MEEIETGAAPAAEPVEPVTPVEPVEPVAPVTTETLSAEIEKELAGLDKGSSLIDDYGIDKPVSYDDSSEGDLDADAPSDKSGLKSENDRLRKQLAKESARNEVQQNLDRILKQYPHAYDKTVHKLIRDGRSAEQIEGVLNASHGDYMRGRVETLKEYKTKLDSLKQGAIAEGEQIAREAFGGPPQTPVGAQGAGDMSYPEFRDWSKGKSDAQVQAMLPRVNWKQSNLHGQQIRKR